jgi:hypothetical protein
MVGEAQATTPTAKKHEEMGETTDHVYSRARIMILI